MKHKTIIFNENNAFMENYIYFLHGTPRLKVLPYMHTSSTSMTITIYKQPSSYNHSLYNVLFIWSLNYSPLLAIPSPSFHFYTFQPCFNDLSQSFSFTLLIECACLQLFSRWPTFVIPKTYPITGLPSLIFII